MISKEELIKIPLFAELSDEQAGIIAEHFSLRIFLPGEHIFFRGEPGHSMFVILNGKVIGTLTNAEGTDYTIATLREGTFVGELGLLAGEPRSAHVKAITPVLAAEIDQGAYRALINVFPEFESRLLQLLGKRAERVKMLWQGDRVKSVKGISRSLAPHRKPVREDPFPGVSQWARDMRKTIDEVGATDAHVLIVGETGTERVMVSRMIVSKSKRDDRPFLFMNCSHPPPGGKTIGGAETRSDAPSFIEEAQESALFGHEAGSTSYAKATRRGYLDIADTGTLVLDHIDYLAPKVQILLLRYLQTSRFVRIGGTEERTSKVRIIATTTRDMDALVAEGKFSAELLALLRGRVIQLIPLRERKEDIPAIVQYLRTRYKRKHQEQVDRVSDGALQLLAKHDWPLNFSELKQVLSQAVAACQGEVIDEEHIFLDIRHSLPSAPLNLLKIEKIKRFLRHPMVPAVLQYVTVPFFLTLILFTLLGPKEHNLGNIIAWSLLWPLLLLSVAFGGRGFCSYCPISAISNVFTLGRRKFLPSPDAMRKYGLWGGIVAFVSVFWIEHLTEAFVNARVTGIVFIAITSGAIITALLFGNRIWCLNICPLGRMLGEFAALSMTELRANSRVCLYQCETHTCLKEKSCPMGLHPSTERTGRDCILCFACVRKCKQKAVHLDVMLPHHRILAKSSWEFSRSAFVVLLVGSILGSGTLRWLSGHRTVSVLSIPEIHLHGIWENFVALVAVTVGFAALTFTVSRTKKFAEWVQNFAFEGYGYLPLAFFGLFTYYFRQLIVQGKEIPRLLAELPVLRIASSPPLTISGLAVLNMIPPLLTLAGGILSLYLLRRLRGKYALPTVSYHLHQAIIALTCLLFIIIL